MAKHKAPAQVTILRQEKSAFEQFVDRNWRLGLIVFLGLAAIWVYSVYSEQQALRNQGQEWTGLGAAQRSGELEQLQQVRQDAAGTVVAAWADLSVSQVARVEDRPEVAREALDRLASANSPFLNQARWPLGPEGALVSIADHLKAAAAAEKAFDEEHNILDNPAPPAGSPRAILHTDKGDIEIALYLEQAPGHVKNFMNLARDGYYDGTKFHRVVKSASMWIIQGGDPNSRDNEDTSTWGQGGPDYGIDPETKNGLIHARGYLAAAKPPGGPQSSGSQFYITVGPCHSLDGGYTVYGKVLDGMDVAEEIGDGEIRPAGEAGRDLPVEPVTVQSVEILEG